MLSFSQATGDLTFSASAVPESSTYAAILGTAAFALAVWRRRISP
ncbi:MAG: PEP-CTERM sorting domain-containing protein [Opitutaceae bacterium]